MKTRRYKNKKYKKYTQSWTAERREKQAKTIKDHKPWLNATGPKSAAGKAASSVNATKHGMRNALMMDLYRAMAAQGRILRRIETRLKGSNHGDRA